MSFKDDHPNASHTQFPYYFSDIEGIEFGILEAGDWDLLIYYGSSEDVDCIDCKCSGWKRDDWTVKVTTWLTKNQLDILLNNISPGAVGESYRLLGKPKYYDKTFTDSNTLQFKVNHTPKIFTESKLRYMFDNVSGYVKNITTSVVPNTEYIRTSIVILLSDIQNYYVS